MQSQSVGKICKSPTFIFGNKCMNNLKCIHIDEAIFFVISLFHVTLKHVNTVRSLNVVASSMCKVWHHTHLMQKEQVSATH